jgi:diketogulonate reductase-like aldo/keto reductase
MGKEVGCLWAGLAAMGSAAGMCIPKTVSEEHLRQYGNDALLSWSLTDEAMEALDELEDGHKYCWNPAPIR